MEQCKICNRDLVDGSYNFHHLIPKQFGGKEQIDIHLLCHDKLHHTFSEREMFKYYNTIDRILEHKEIKKFVRWVKKKDPLYYSKSKDTKSRNKKR